jgi:hypothetical protein
MIEQKIRITLDAVVMETVDGISRCEITAPDGDKLTMYYDQTSGKVVSGITFNAKKLG